MATNSPRSRCFFLTINPGAKCYEEVEEILKNGVFKIWAFIVHDKDTNAETGELKPKHKHAIIELENARTFVSIQKQFEGAHVEIPNYKKSTYQYLLHNSPKSKDKYQYAFDEIKSNSIDYVKNQIESEEYEPFIENKVLDYIAEGTLTAFSFTQRFGFDIYARYFRAYSNLIQDIKGDKAAKNEIEARRKAIDLSTDY